MSVYLDHNATTPLDAKVLEAMIPYMSEVYGNPSSMHRYGRITRDGVEQARLQVARLVGAEPNQIVFTSGGTEANNLALKGVLEHAPGCRFAVSSVEHNSVLEPARRLQNNGWQMNMIAVNDQGQVEAESVNAQLEKDTKFVSIMAANNETGVLQDISSLCKQVKAYDERILFHSDACQMAGKQPLDFTGLGVDLMSLSSHKFYGPQGVGALVVKRALDLAPQMLGGGQESNRRSGTENIAALVGFGVAAEQALQKMAQRQQATQVLQQRLIKQLVDLQGVQVFSLKAERLPNTVQFSVQGIDGETLLMLLDKKGFAVSSGSACDSGQTDPSHVLLAMAVPAEIAGGAIRVSFGEQNVEKDVSQFIEALNVIRQQFN